MRILLVEDETNLAKAIVQGLTKKGYAVEIIIPTDDIQTFYNEVCNKYRNNIVEPLEKRFSKFDFRITARLPYDI